MSGTPFKFGSIEYPLTGVTSASSLLDVCDPAVKIAGAYFTQMLNTYLGTALTVVAADVGGPTIASNVAQFYPYDPGLIAKYVQGSFPLLAVWRKSSTHGDKSVASWEQEASRWGVAYILPPLDAGQMERVRPVLHSVSHIIQHAIRMRSDPTYNGGTSAWESAGVSKVTLLTSEYDDYAFADTGALAFGAWRGEVEVVEKFNSTTNGSDVYTNDDGVITDGSLAPNNPITVVELETDIPA